MKWLLKEYMALRKIDSLKQLSRDTGIKEGTLHLRIQKPTTLKVMELVALDNVLHFEDSDLLRLSRGQV